MKKTKLIAGVLTAAMLLIGTGYATWSETATITNTAETGSLSVEFVQEGLHPYITHFDNVSGVTDALSTDLTHDPKVTVVMIKDLYPGATAMLETRIKNLGTIPAVAADAEVNYIGEVSEAAKENIIVRGQITHWRPSSSGAVLLESEGLPVDTGVPLKDLEARLTTMVQGLDQLMPGDFLTFDVTKEYADQLTKVKDFEAYDPNGNNSLFFTLPSNTGNETENLSANFQIKINFKQFNK